MGHRSSLTRTRFQGKNMLWNSRRAERTWFVDHSQYAQAGQGARRAPGFPIRTG